MKLIFKSMVSLLVLANLAGAASKDEAAESSSARPVFALPAPGFDEMFRDIALNAGRVHAQIGGLVLMAPQDQELKELNSRLDSVRDKLELRKGQWDELKGSIEDLRMEMKSIPDAYLRGCASEEILDEESKTMKPKYAAEHFINLANTYLQGVHSSDPSTEIVLSRADLIFSVRQNISGLTEILAELEGEVASRLLRRPTVDAQYEAASSSADRVAEQISVLALAAPENPRIAELRDQLNRAKAKLSMRQAQWEELKGSIESVRHEVASIEDAYVQSIAKEHEGRGLLSPEVFLNLFEKYINGKEIYDTDKVVQLADKIFSTRQNISGLTEILKDLEEEAKALAATN